MIKRPASLTWAVGLLLLIGGSGIAAGASLLGAAANGPVLGVDVRGAALGLGGAITGYGIAAVSAGIGLFRLRRWAWWLGFVIVAIGLVVLGFAAQVGGLDPILAFGVVLWGVILAALVAPTTREALAAGRGPREPG